ncbi:SH3 domain-containing protein [Candidatus Avelusimicrobium facis]|uniref:SH3 domain-containing protein n=1 Tax=Candidatus Avelusimicrobium facis TaxID=3416203 RepID=UPI0015B697B5
MMKKIAAAALLVCFVSAPLLAQKYASINTTKANIRTCAGTKCAVKFYAWKYTPVIMVKASPDKEWVQVKDFEGFTGWVSSSLLSPKGGMSAKVDLNVRKGPGVSNEIVCTVEKGYPFKYISKKGSWIEVEDDPADPKQGKCRGWIFNKNLWGFFKQ